MLEYSLSGTSDKGTEAGIPYAPPTCFKDFFPYFTDDFQDDTGLGDPGRQEDGNIKLSTPNCIAIAGKLHIISRLTKGLLQAMPHYTGKILRYLNELTKFLNQPWMMERLRHQCFGHHPLNAYASFFVSFPWTLVKWRWFSFVPVVRELLIRKNALRAGWSLERLTFQRPEAEDRRGAHQHEDSANLDVVNEAVTSPLFWGWLEMASVLVDVVSHIEAWICSCPCHSKSVETSWTARAHAVGLGQVPRASCPLLGRRMPEIAAGELQSIVDALLALAVADVSFSWSADLTAEYRGFISEDFEVARKHMVFSLQVFLAPYQRLPRVLAGVCHVDPLKSRQCLMSALQQWDALDEPAQAASHSVTKLFCSEGVVRDQALEYLSRLDSDLSDFEELFVNAARLAMIPLVEITVEGKHALVQKELKRSPHSGAPSLSLLQRLPPIIRRIDEDPAYLDEVAAMCSRTYHPKKSSRELGIQGHPDIQKILESMTLVIPEAEERIEFAVPTMKYAKQVKGLAS